MFDILPLIILREIFIRIINQKDILNFKISLKRISSFVNKDRVCQEHYLKTGYNLKINLNKNDHFKCYEDLILCLESKNYSKFFCSGFELDNKRIFIRPSDDAVVLFYPDSEDDIELIGCLENSIVDKIWESIENKNNNFEIIMNSEGFFQVTFSPIEDFYNENLECVFGYFSSCEHTDNIIIYENSSKEFRKYYIDNIMKN